MPLHSVAPYLSLDGEKLSDVSDALCINHSINNSNSKKEIVSPEPKMAKSLMHFVLFAFANVKAWPCNIAVEPSCNYQIRRCNFQMGKIQLINTPEI